MYKYRITVMESERGWGQDFWNEDLDSPEKAQARIDEINSHNTAPGVPEYYIQALPGITPVKVDTETK